MRSRVYRPDHSSPAPIDVRLDPEARQVWIAFYNEHAQKQATIQNGDLAAAFSKLEGYAARAPAPWNEPFRSDWDDLRTLAPACPTLPSNPSARLGHPDCCWPFTRRTSTALLSYRFSSSWNSHKGCIGERDFYARIGPTVTLRLALTDRGAAPAWDPG